MSAVPPERKLSERVAPVLGPWKPLIRTWVTADQVLPKKQRHTARRIWQRLVDEHGAELGESTVSGYVAQLRRELSGGVACVTVPQVHPPGEEAEVDFGELWVWLEGTLTKVWLFVLRLSASGRAFHVAFASQAAEAFLEGHVLAFQALGGVPGGSATTTCGPRSTGSCRAATGWRTSGSSRCAATTGSIPSSASPAGAARTRRAGWRVRSVGSADATWFPSRSFRR